MTTPINDFDTLQNQLATQVSLLSYEESNFLHENSLIFTLDVQYVGERGFIACDIQTLGGAFMWVGIVELACTVPYTPQYFGFRETPLLVETITRIMQLEQLKPDLIIIDGHGIAHPRRCGAASMVGIALQLPTIGCAKEPLLKYSGTLGNQRGEFLTSYIGNEPVGRVLRTQTGIKPVFLSVGHLFNIEKATEIILHLSSAYRISEPLRRADQYARAAAKQEQLPQMRFYESISK